MPTLTPNGFFDYIEGPVNLIINPIQEFQKDLDALLSGLAGGGAIYYDTDYTSLSEAITDIGSAVSTLNISTPLFPNGATCTAPSTLTINWTGAGSLNMTTAQTVTIGSDVSHWPVRKLFYNAAIGQGIVLFTGAAGQHHLWVDWWAIGDNSTDDTAALNAAFVAWPFGTTMHLSPRKNYRHTGLTVDHKAQVTLEGSRSLSGQIDNFWAGKLIYNGSDGGYALTLNNVYASTFRGFGIDGAASAGATGAARGIYLTMTAGGTPGLTSHCTFKSLTIHPISTRSTWSGIHIDNASGANNEQHELDNIRFFGSYNFPNQVGTGIYLGHFNVKQVVIERCSFTWLGYGIYSNNGSMHAKNNIWFENDVMYGGIYSDVILIEGDDSESNTQLLNLNSAGDNPLTLKNGRYGSLRGGQVATATSTADPIIQINTGFSAPHLIVEGNYFEVLGPRFTSDFIRSDNGGVVIEWGINRFGSTTGDPSYKVMSAHDLHLGLRTFAQIVRSPIPLGSGDGTGFMIAARAYGSPSMVDGQVSFSGMTSSRSVRRLIGVIGSDFNANYLLRVGSRDSIEIGESAEIELAGYARPNRPDLQAIGVTGSTAYQIAIIARDSVGNRTMPGDVNQNFNNFNATLSGSNYVQVTWPRIPGATDYLVLQRDPGGGFRIVATVAANGTDTESYNIVANPTGAFTYAIPTFNERSQINVRGRVIAIIESAFAANDTTPSVVQGNDFVTANSSATSISYFDHGVNGQILRIRVNDANTTFVHGSGIQTRTAANVVATNGLIYQFILRGGTWYQL